LRRGNRYGAGLAFWHLKGPLSCGFVRASGAFGQTAVEREETIEEFAAKVGCSVADILASHAGDDERDVDDDAVCNPPAGASWVNDRTTPLRRLTLSCITLERPFALLVRARY
jgi:hypothetical protein